MPSPKRITVRGFKSIRALERFELRDLNVLIGANGSGKSNLISLFEMLAALVERRLQLHVREHDGPDALLFGTRKRTGQMDAELDFGRNGYRLSLKASGDRLVFAREETWVSGDVTEAAQPLGVAHDEARLPEIQDDTSVLYVGRRSRGGVCSTSTTRAIRRPCGRGSPYATTFA